MGRNRASDVSRFWGIGVLFKLPFEKFSGLLRILCVLKQVPGPFETQFSFSSVDGINGSLSLSVILPLVKRSGIGEKEGGVGGRG